MFSLQRPCKRQGLLQKYLLGFFGLDNRSIKLYKFDFGFDFIAFVKKAIINFYTG